MIVLGILLTIFNGYLLVNLISDKFTFIEKAGLSFLIGIFIETLIILFADMIGVSLGFRNILYISLFIMLLLMIPYFRNPGKLYKGNFSLTFDYSGLNAVWLLFVILICYFEYMNFSKCMYFPTFDRDSLAGFDTMGYIAAMEKTYKGMSIFNGEYNPNINSAGSYITYAPMVQLSYAYVYMLGAKTSKLIPALTYLFFLIAFYGVSRRVMKDMFAAIITFFVLITPEMIAFSSLSATNVIHAAYASLGIIYIAVWWRYSEQKDLLIGTVLLGANMWCRTDGIVFIGAALLIIFIKIIKEKKYKQFLYSFILCFLPALFWVVFQKIFSIHSESIAITQLFYDNTKLMKIGLYISSLLINVHFYGITFIVFTLSIVINLRFLIKNSDNLYLLSMIILSYLAYMLLLYQIDYKWDTIENVLMYSAKRFTFCFIPMIWFYIATNKTSLWLNDKINNMLKFPVKLNIKSIL